MILLGAGSPKELSSSMPGFHHVSPLHQSKIGYDFYFRKVFNKMLKSAMEYLPDFAESRWFLDFLMGCLAILGNLLGLCFMIFMSLRPLEQIWGRSFGLVESCFCSNFNQQFLSGDLSPSSPGCNEKWPIIPSSCWPKKLQKLTSSLKLNLFNMSKVNHAIWLTSRLFT